MIRPRACWGAACDLLGMSVVYPAGGTVTISKKSPLIRILSKRTDCIDFEENVKTRLCRGRRPRRPAEVGGGTNSPGRGETLPDGVKDQRTVMERPRAGHARPLQGGGLRGSYLSIRHASRAFVISPWIRVDTRSTRAAGSSFMPVRTHSSVRPTKAYL